MSAAVEEPVGWARVISAPSAPGAQQNSGFCPKPGHGNFEQSMWCADCDAKFCIRCTALHVGHQTMDETSAKFFRRTSSVPSKAESREAVQSQFDDHMAAFRRTSSASTQAAAVCLPLPHTIQSPAPVRPPSRGALCLAQEPGWLPDRPQRAIALANKLQRRLTVVLDSTATTLKSAQT